MPNVQFVLLGLRPLVGVEPTSLAQTCFLRLLPKADVPSAPSPDAGRVRHLKKEGEYFVCTDFRKPGSQDEYYDIDFWVNQKTGKLEVDNVKVHKVPVQEDGIWTQIPRYTFEGMDIEETP